MKRAFARLFTTKVTEVEVKSEEDGCTQQSFTLIPKSSPLSSPSAATVRINDAAAKFRPPQLETSFFSPEELPPDSPVQFLKISAVGTSKDLEGKPFSVYCLEVQSSRAMPSSWVVYRRFSQFCRLRDHLVTIDHILLDELPPRSNEFSRDMILARMRKLASWLSSLLEYHLRHPGAESTYENPHVRKFLCHNPNIVPDTFSVLYSLPKESVPMSPAFATPATPGGSRTTLQDFQLVKVIGKGTFGKVSLVRKKKANGSEQLFAMKALKRADISHEQQCDYVLRERRILQNVASPFIARMHFAFKTPDTLFFILEYAAGGELLFHLTRCKRFNESATAFYCAELCLAIEHLHSRDIIYRDMKPENILLDGKGHVKLVDFGLAKEGVKSATSGALSFAGTEQYLAPEIIDKSGHGKAVDWWGLGMVAYEMLTGLPPWFTDDSAELFQSIRYAPVRFPKYVSRKAATFIQGLLTKEVFRRLGTSGGAEEVQNHNFFMTTDWSLARIGGLKPPFTPCSNDREINEADNFEEEFKSMPLDYDDLLGASVRGSVNTLLAEGFEVDDRFQYFPFEDEGKLANMREAQQVVPL